MKRARPVEERLMARISVNAATGCWEWTARKQRQGYGVIDIAREGDRPRPELAHRIAYLLLEGPIPEGLQLDHLCRNRACVNPAHLEPVTNAENQRRGAAATKTHCIHGHAFTPENTYTRRRNGRRVCRTCSLNRRQRSRTNKSEPANDPAKVLAGSDKENVHA